MFERLLPLINLYAMRFKDVEADKLPLLQGVK